MAQERVFTDKIAELEAAVAQGGVKGNTAKAELETLKNKFSNEKVRLEKIKLAAEKKRRLSQNKVNQFAAQAAADKEAKLKSELSAKDEAEKAKSAQEAADRAAKKKAIQVRRDCVCVICSLSHNVSPSRASGSKSKRHCVSLASNHHAIADAVVALHHSVRARHAEIHFASLLAPVSLALAMMIQRHEAVLQRAPSTPTHARVVTPATAAANSAATQLPPTKGRSLKGKVKQLCSVVSHCGWPSAL
jgi:hypothetical protein